MHRFNLAANRVRSLTYYTGSEPLDRSIAAKLALHFRRYLPYPNQHPFPFIQKIVWNDDTGVNISPLLFLLLSPDLKLESFSLSGSYQSPRDVIIELREHIPRGLKTLTIDWVDHEEPGLYDAVSALLRSLPVLEDLCFSRMPYKALQIHPLPNRNPNLKIMTIRNQVDEEEPIILLETLTRSVPSVERLRLEIAHPEETVREWSFHDFNPLKKVAQLKELQVFADGDCIAGESQLLPSDVHSMGRYWAGLQDLNLHDILGCSPQILDAFGESLPKLRRLALCFDKWGLGDSSSVKCLRSLRILAFNIPQIPRDIVGLLGSYLAFVCPKDARFASVKFGDALDAYREVFATIVDASSEGIVGELCRTVDAVIHAREMDRARIAAVRSVIQVCVSLISVDGVFMIAMQTLLMEGSTLLHWIQSAADFALSF